LKRRFPRLIAGLAAALALASCASLQGEHCHAHEKASVLDTLYLGAATPEGSVTAQAWTRFLEVEVTPRFPQGLTVTEASGQWRAADGTVLREPAHVLQLVHPGDAASEKAVAEIVASYKTRFRQEAVLRVRVPACTSF
jgi:hypothetical protein